jgi:hypothetical protein
MTRLVLNWTPSSTKCSTSHWLPQSAPQLPLVTFETLCWNWKHVLSNLGSLIGCYSRFFSCQRRVAVRFTVLCSGCCIGLPMNFSSVVAATEEYTCATLYLATFQTVVVLRTCKVLCLHPGEPRWNTEAWWATHPTWNRFLVKTVREYLIRNGRDPRMRVWQGPGNRDSSVDE